MRQSDVSNSPVTFADRCKRARVAFILGRFPRISKNMMPTPSNDSPASSVEDCGQGWMPVRVNVRLFLHVCLSQVVVMALGVSGAGALGRDTEELSRAHRQQHEHERDRQAALLTLPGQPASSGEATFVFGDFGNGAPQSTVERLLDTPATVLRPARDSEEDKPISWLVSQNAADSRNEGLDTLDAIAGETRRLWECRTELHSAQDAARGCLGLPGDSICDPELNTEECGYDGGDCCACTCANTAFTCGQYAKYDCLDPGVECAVEGDTPGPSSGFSPGPSSDYWSMYTFSPSLGPSQGPSAAPSPGFTAGPSEWAPPEYGSAPSTRSSPGPRPGFRPMETLFPSPGPSAGLSWAPSSSPTSGRRPGLPPGRGPAPITGHPVGPSPGTPPSCSPPILAPSGRPTTGPSPAPATGPHAAPSPVASPDSIPEASPVLDPAPSPLSVPDSIPEPSPGPGPAPSPIPVPGPSPVPTLAPPLASTLGPIPGASPGPIAALSPGPTSAVSPAPSLLLQSTSPEAIPIDERELPPSSTSSSLEEEFTIDETELSDSSPAEAIAASLAFLAIIGIVLTTMSTLLKDSSDGSPATNSSSVRQPAATMAVVVVAQVQLLATLSLVDNTGSDESTVSDVADNLGWVNLWPPTSFASGFTPARTSSGVDETVVAADSFTPKEVSRHHPGPFSSSDDVHEAESEEDGDSAMVFMGNLVLVVAILMGIFLIHVVLASAVEAYWVSQKRAKEEVIRAERQGIPLDQLSVRPSGRWIRHDPTAGEDSECSLPGTARSSDGQDGSDRTDEEEGRVENARRKSRLRLREIAECRAKSQSAWLHFPHVELVFLLFAFQGAVVAQVSAIRENASPAVLFLAIAALLLFPVLMTVMVARTFFSKVKPDDHIVFVPCDDEPDGMEGESSGRLARFGSKVKSSLLEDQSMFGWADKGQWESVETPEREGKTERDWFRIGFEPIFADFTRSGSWFMIYTLLEWIALGMVGALVDDSVVQLSLFCAMNAVSFLLLVIVKPFANSAINLMGIALYGSDAVCMGMLAVAASKFQGTATADRIDTAVMVIQLVALAAIIIPMYVDTAFTMIGALGRKVRRHTNEDAQTNVEELKFTRRYVRTTWARIWCTMFRQNVFACFRDTSAGINQPSTRNTDVRPFAGSTAARTLPCPQKRDDDDAGGVADFRSG